MSTPRDITDNRPCPRHDGNAVTDAMAMAWATQTRAAQGLPLHVVDPGVLHRVLILMGRRRTDDPAA